MSLGQQFLARLNEAKAPAPVKKKAFSFDPAVESMKRGMRDIGGSSDLADKIGEVMSLCGIPGIYLNKQDVKVSVVDAAQALRTKAARVRAFLSLHSALCAFYGVAEPVNEAKMDPKEKFLASWVNEYGDGYVESTPAKTAKNFWTTLYEPENKHKLKRSKALDLTDADVLDYFKKTKINEAKAEAAEFSDEELEGSQFQKMVEEILVLLGAPRDLVTGEAKSAVKSSLKRVIAKLRQDENVRMAVLTLARYAGIKMNDGVAGEKKVGPKKVAEAVEAGAPSVSDLWQAASTVFAKMGLNLNDEKTVRVVNQTALIRAVKTACRNPATKAGIVAFLQKTKAE